MAFHESKVILKDAEAARDAITAAQYQHISGLYTEWANELGEQAKFWAGKDTQSALMRELQYKQLQQAVTEQSHVVSNGVYQSSKDALYTVSEAVVSSLTAYTASLGFEHMAVAAAYNSIPTTVVNQLVTGQLYENGWNLSSAIWGNNEKELQRIYEIMAGGLAQNKSAFEIAKTLEQYVNPNAAKQWNLVDAGGVRIYPRSVDYSAQRLVRTLSQHSYQSTLVTTTKNNPFIEKFVWHAEGSRACPMCTDMDGLEFDKGKLPLDHPNGMCTFEPVIDKNLVDKLADWVNSPDGTYPDIDGFAKSFGYTPQKAAQKGMQYMTQAKGVVNTALNATTYADCIKALDSYMGLGGKTAGSYVDNVVTTIAKGKKYGGSKEKVYQAFVNGKTTGAQTKQIENAIAKSQKQVAKVLEDKSKGVKNYAQLKKEKEAAEAAKKAAEEKAKFEAAKKNFPNTLGKNGAGSESKSWQTWYKKLTPEDKRVVDALKKESGKGWATWYQENVYTGKSYVSGTKAAKDANKAKKASQTVSGGSTSVDSKLAKDLQAFYKQYADKISDWSEMSGWLQIKDPDMWSKMYKGVKSEFKALPDEVKAKFGSVTEYKNAYFNQVIKGGKTSVDVPSFKVDVSDVKKVFNGYYSTTTPLYTDFETKFGKDALDEFKAALHEIKNQTGKTYHIDVWNDYVAGKLDSSLASKIDAVFEKNASKYNQLVKDAKAAKPKTAQKPVSSTYKKSYTKYENSGDELSAIANSETADAKTSKEAWQAIKDANETKGVSQADSSTWIEGVKTNSTSNQLVMEDKGIKRMWNAEEKASIKYYTGSGYNSINGAMRNIAKPDIEPICEAVRSGDRAAFNALMQKNGIRENIHEHIWNNIQAFQKTIVQETTYVRRGTSLGEIGGLFADGVSYSERSAIAGRMSADEMNAAFAGKVGAYDSMVSTSAMYGKGFSGDCEIIFCVPKGSEAASVMRISNFDTGEGETILNYGTKVRFVRAERSDGHKGSRIRVFLEVIPQH